jgi:hypothetical protein
LLKRIVSAGVATVGLLAFMTPAAHADTPTANYDLGTQFGNVHRATLAENADGSGNYIRVFGSSPCTATRSDTDNRINVVPPGWNDAISWIADFNQCDVDLYVNGGTTGTHSGYINYGPAGKYVGSTWNERASSFTLS